MTGIGGRVFKVPFSNLTGIAKIDGCVVFATLPGIGESTVIGIFSNKKAGAINSGILTKLNKTIMKI